MAVNQNFEDSVKSKVYKINELEMATAFITDKDELKSDLLDAVLDVDTISRSIFSMRQNLDFMKEQNDNCKKSIIFLHSLEDKIESLENNIPADLIRALSRVETEMTEQFTEKVKNGHHAMSSKKAEQFDGDIIDVTEYLPKLTDCRKTLFIDAEDNYYNIEPLNDVEFAKIPKYMIGRQTLVILNDFIAVINKILKAKYSLLALGKNGARKKGDLDLYLQFKKEEADVCSGKERKYFFTADDYQREMKCKLDKTKLNLLTVLRHCRKIQELRSGKNVKYEPTCLDRLPRSPTANSLEVHIKRHNGSRSYVCNICEKSYTQSSHMWTHKRFILADHSRKKHPCKRLFNICQDIHKKRNIE